jgi:hypothetical protein
MYRGRVLGQGGPVDLVRVLFQVREGCRVDGQGLGVQFFVANKDGLHCLSILIYDYGLVNIQFLFETECYKLI